MELGLVTARRVVLPLQVSSLDFSRNLGDRPTHGLGFPVWGWKLGCRREICLLSRARKKGGSVEPVLKETLVEEGKEGEAYEGVEDDYVEDDFDDEILLDDNEDFEEEYEDEGANAFVGDGGEGGGISFAGTWWDKQALAIAEEASMSFNGDLKIYAFKTLANSTIRLRIEKLSTKYGSPSVSDIEAFTSAYQARLDEAERTGTIPGNIYLEVSSPGVERVLRIPEELERFKDKPMYVRYAVNDIDAASHQESDGVFRLISFDLELCYCTWGIADVKINRAQAGKGRPLNKKQREWRLETPFDSLRLVRIYSDC